MEAEETIEDCLKRMTAEGYTVAGRKEEPLFTEVNGEYIPVQTGNQVQRYTNRTINV